MAVVCMIDRCGVDNVTCDGVMSAARHDTRHDSLVVMMGGLTGAILLLAVIILAACYCHIRRRRSVYNLTYTCLCQSRTGRVLEAFLMAQCPVQACLCRTLK